MQRFKHKLWSFVLGASLLVSMVTANAKDIVVGQISPLTGSNSTNGIPLSEGARLYFEYLNSKGGINGNRIKFIAKDDAYKAEETVKQAHQLIDVQEAVVLMAVLGTANNEALIKEKILTTSGTPLVGPRTGATSLYKVPEIFTIRASYHDEARKIIRQLTTMGIQKVGIVYQDDGFGNDGLTGLTNALMSFNIKPLIQASFERNTLKVEGAVDQMLTANPQAIVFVGVTAPAAAFVQLYRNKGGTSQIICLSAVDSSLLVKQIGDKAADGLSVSIVMPNPYRMSTPVVREMASIKEQMGAKDLVLSFNSVEGFIYAKVVAEALRRAGPNPTRESVRSALETIRNYDVGGFTADLGHKDTNQRYVDLVVVGSGGKLLQ